MKHYSTIICILALTGCASELPYSISIGTAPGTGNEPGPEQCVLRLDTLVQQVAHDFQLPTSTIRGLQIQFEQALHHHTQSLKNCTDRQDRPVQVKDAPPIEEVAKKSLASYALDAADPDQELDRFREYLRSAQLVQHLARRPLLPDENPLNTYDLVEKTSMRQSQWCGTLTPEITKPLTIPLLSPAAQVPPSQPMEPPARTGTSPEKTTAQSPCFRARSLYHVRPEPEALYQDLLAEIAQVEAKGTERNQRYFVLGYELPWDADRTLVRYGVTFYFKQSTPENTTQAYNNTAPAQLIGYDLIYANEATPETLEEAAPASSKAEVLPWQKNSWRITEYPFSLVIGLKNAAFEIAKIPFSTIAGIAFGRDAYNYPLENLETAYNSLYVEATTQTHWGALGGLYRLLTELPLVGQLFHYNMGVDRSEKDELSPDTRRKIFLSRGIYGGNKWGQDTGLWALFAKQSYPTYDIYSPPYRHGTVIDVIWSMFNLSHGPAYSEARYVIDHASRNDRLYLAGHSGGVQRSAAASRILSFHQYDVVKVVGIAGPSIGQAFVDSRYPAAFNVYLNTGSGANEDVVSKVGAVAGAYSTLLDYTMIVPLKYVIGNLIFWKRDSLYGFFDRIGFTNATIVEVTRKPSSRHQTPLRLSFTDRLVYDAYLRNEFATTFREDLERPDSPHEPDRPHAFPWER